MFGLKMFGAGDWNPYGFRSLSRLPKKRLLPFCKNNAPYLRKGHNLLTGFFKVLPSHRIFIRNFFIKCYPRTYHLDNRIIHIIFRAVNSLPVSFSLFFTVKPTFHGFRFTSFTPSGSSSVVSIFPPTARCLTLITP